MNRQAHNTFAFTLLILFLISSSQCLESSKIKVELYYESLCPGCQEFIVNQIFPTLQAPGVSDIVDLHLIPYGNAIENLTKHGYEFKCQHGRQECEANMFEACALFLKKEDSKAAFPFIYCMERALSDSASPSDSADKCAKLFEIDTEKLHECANGPQGNLIMHKFATQTDSLKPAHRYVPWLVVNGVHTEEIQEAITSDMLAFVCKNYSGPKPRGCPSKLE
jgi:interferon gamma-inducible protein 30